MHSGPTSTLLLRGFLRFPRQKWNYILKGLPCLVGPLGLFISLLEKHSQGRAPLTHESAKSPKLSGAQSCVTCRLASMEIQRRDRSTSSCLSHVQDAKKGRMTTSWSKVPIPAPPLGQVSQPI